MKVRVRTYGQTNVSLKHCSTMLERPKTNLTNVFVLRYDIQKTVQKITNIKHYYFMSKYEIIKINIS